jgi:hypothetical protein
VVPCSPARPRSTPPEYATLEGQDGVFIETRIGFDVDRVEIKARLDFGAKAIDWRGMHKNAGVAL